MGDKSSDNSYHATLLKQNIQMSPTRVEFELTEQCNLACRFCYNSQKPLVSNFAWDIIEHLYNEGVMEIILTGGEPMLHPQFKELLIKCGEIFSKVMVQTNGTYVTQEYAQLFLKQKIFGVNISLHGEKRVHELLTKVPGSYELALKGIKNLVKYGVRVASNFVLTSENISSLEATIETLYSVGLREITLTRFTPTGVGTSSSNLALPKSSLNNALQIANKERELHKDLRIIAANSIPFCALDDNLKYFCEYCHFGSSRFYIDVHGNVLMCGMSRVKIGNILRQTFKEMKAQSDIYQSHICGIDVPDGCKVCDKFPICRGGCRAAAYAYSGNFSGPDPYSNFA